MPQLPVDTTISQRELRNDSGTIMRRVEQGESFIVTRNGAPVADLIPHNATGIGVERPRFVPVEAIASGFASISNWGTQTFTADLSVLDAAVDDRDVDPWNGR